MSIFNKDDNIDSYESMLLSYGDCGNINMIKNELGGK